VENWWDKYRVTLRDIEWGRETVKEKFEEVLGDLSYV
jgi:hypothetical protein